MKEVYFILEIFPQLEINIFVKRGYVSPFKLATFQNNPYFCTISGL